MQQRLRGLTLRRCSAFSTVTSRAMSPFSAAMACRALTPFSPAHQRSHAIKPLSGAQPHPAETFAHLLELQTGPQLIHGRPPSAY